MERDKSNKIGSAKIVKVGEGETLLIKPLIKQIKVQDEGSGKGYEIKRCASGGLQMIGSK